MIHKLIFVNSFQFERREKINARMKKFLLIAFSLNVCVIFITVNDYFDVYVASKYQNESRKQCVVNTLADTLVVVNFNYPGYNTMRILQELYNGVFGRVISCGAEISEISNSHPDLIVPLKPTWFFRYQCLAMGIKKYPNFKGKEK